MIQQTELLSEIREVTVAVQSVFQVESDLEQGQLESLHRRLSQCIEAVNDRLRGCDALLRRGLRAEAVQECDIAPPLLDLVTELDIPELEPWGQYVRQFGIAPQPTLLLDIAASLNQAYHESLSLDGLLNLHRLHALARSPLTARIKILRSIAERDSENPVWPEDLRQYESARLREIASECSALRNERDLERLYALVDEMHNSAWLVQPHAKLLDQVNGAFSEVRRDYARDRLIVIETRLTAAFSNFDTVSARSASDEWRELIPVAELSMNAPIVQRTAAALDWLDQEDAQEQHKNNFQRALVDLEQALDSESTTKSELLKQMSAIERFGEALPERVQRRYDERLRYLELKETRRSRLVLVASSSAIVLFAAMIAGLVLIMLRSSEIRSASDSLASLLEQGQIEEAKHFVDQQSIDQPYVVASPEMQKLIAQLQQSLREEQAREERLSQLVNRSEELLQDKPTWEQLAQAQLKLHEAKALARHEHELVSIERMQGDIGRKRNHLQTILDKQFTESVEAFKKRLGEVRADDLNGLRLQRTHAQKLSQQIRVSASAKQASGIDAIIQQLRDRERNWARAEAGQRLSRRIRTSLRTVQAYTREMDFYIREAKSGRRSEAFKRVLANEKDTFSKVEAWNKVAGEWNALSERFFQSDMARAKAILGTVKTHFGDFPPVDFPVDLVTYIESIEKRSRVIDTLNRIFENPLFTLNYLQESDSDRYYFNDQPKTPDPSTIVVHALVTHKDLDKVVEKRFDKSALRPMGGGDFVGVVPLAKVAENAIAAIAEPDGQFEEKVCTILNDVVHLANTDPVLQCHVLQAILETGKQGSPLVEMAFKGYETELSKYGEWSDINWIVTDDNKVTLKRNLAQKTLQSITPDPESVYHKHIAPILKALSGGDILLAKLDWAGTILINSSGEWEPIIRDDFLRLSGDLVQRHYPDQGPPSMVTIGQISNGKVAMDKQATLAFVEGRPIWLVRRAR